jgi:WD40 repeat protein
LALITCEYLKSSNEYINYLNLYSFNEIHEGPFKVFPIHNMSKIHQIKFSNDGLLIFVKDEYNKCALFNTFDNSLVKIISPGYENKIHSRCDSSTTSSYNISSYYEEKFELFNFGKTEDYLALGSKDGKVYLWNTITNYDKAYIVNILEGEKTKNSNDLNEFYNCIKFCKDKNIIATAGTHVTIWGL